ncbi:MAG TPA: hypothetical protein VL404_00530 [Candidatus Eisenbacteria bacterium]|nr:hypothetical protein [Candidatus Eisenbacteria bacterium]
MKITAFEANCLAALAGVAAVLFFLVRHLEARDAVPLRVVSSAAAPSEGKGSVR